MRSTTLPPLRVPQEFRREAERALQSGETLSAFMFESIQRNIRRRKLHREFIARGLASAERAEQSGRYYSADEVLDELAAKLHRASRKRR